jgi:DNA-binding XRE family transcriptional regulator
MTLDEYRTACGLSHNAMARELGISINTWRKWVNEPDPPKWLVLATAAVYHRLPPESHNAAPVQHQTATLAENDDGTEV